MQDKMHLIEEVYRKHFGLLVMIGARNFRLPKSLIEELIQETFEKAIKANNEGRIKGRTAGEVRAYILRIFRNSYLDNMRKKKPESVDIEIIDSHVEHTQEISPVELIIQIEEKKMLAMAIDALGPKYSIIIHMHVQNNTAQKISEITGIKYSTVRTRIERGLKKLMKNVRV